MVPRTCAVGSSTQLSQDKYVTEEFFDNCIVSCTNSSLDTRRTNICSQAQQTSILNINGGAYYCISIEGIKSPLTLGMDHTRKHLIDSSQKKALSYVVLVFVLLYLGLCKAIFDGHINCLVSLVRMEVLDGPWQFALMMLQNTLTAVWLSNEDQKGIKFYDASVSENS